LHANFISTMLKFVLTSNYFIKLKMALIAPQYNDHKFINKLRLINTRIFYLIFGCSLLPIVIQYFPAVSRFATIVNIVNITSLIAYFALDFIIEYHLYPLAEDARKVDFIDNSWGTKNSLQNSVLYYDNDELKYGLYKMASNLFQNVFFSYNVSRAMRKSKYGLNIMFTIIILIIACYGFNNVPIAIPLLQVVFSSVILGDLLKHIVLINRLKQVLEKWQGLFQDEEFKDNPDKYRAQVYSIWLYYESTLARTQVSLSEAKFNELNQKLTHDWFEIKKKYLIN